MHVVLKTKQHHHCAIDRSDRQDRAEEFQMHAADSVECMQRTMHARN